MPTQNAQTVQTATVSIPVTDVRPGDLVDTAHAVPRGSVVRIGAVAVSDGVVYVVRRDPGALVPQGYRFDAGAVVALHGRR